MFQLGRPYLEEFGAQFLFTGEVLGQRPMSQMRSAMKRIDRESGMEGWIVRPLSARLLAVTEPERRGWLDRDRLLDIWGRGRTRQIALAERYGLRHYQSPGGGCLLTDPLFSRRLEDLFEHAPEDSAGVEDVALLRLGRHVRVSAGLKIVLGRSAEENQRLLAFESRERWLVEPRGFSGPTALVCGGFSDLALAEAVRLIARFSRATAGCEVGWRAGERSGSVRIGEATNGDGHPVEVAVDSAVARVNDSGS